MNKLKNLSFVLIAIIGLTAVPAFAQNISTPYVSTSMKNPCVSLTASLSKGKYDVSTNGDVTRLQAFLHGKGYLSVTPTGYFGPLTARAVMTFQKENGLSVDGIVGVNTRAHIFAKDCPTGTIGVTPVISAITPAQGKEGTVVTLNGSGFTADSIVHFSIGGIPLVVTGNGTMASFTVPSYVGQYCKPGMVCIMLAQQLNAGTYQLTVENANGISNAVPFVITSNPAN